MSSARSSNLRAGVTRSISKGCNQSAEKLGMSSHRLMDFPRETPNKKDKLIDVMLALMNYLADGEERSVAAYLGDV